MASPVLRKQTTPAPPLTPPLPDPAPVVSDAAPMPAPIAKTPLISTKAPIGLGEEIIHAEGVIKAFDIGTQMVLVLK
ncbi:MAG: hypothetical protein E6Q53_00345, partial [Candidatus Moraniibacteriota bacterium]